jgi:hypothetical protein
MHAISGARGPVKTRPAANDNAPTHPAWRRAVAGGVALIFALTLALFGLMLCVPAFAP